MGIVKVDSGITRARVEKVLAEQEGKSPRLASFKAILAKLDPPEPRPATPPPLTPVMSPRGGRRRRPNG
jgi:hypothetical protein